MHLRRSLPVRGTELRVPCRLGFPAQPARAHTCAGERFRSGAGEAGVRARALGRVGALVLLLRTRWCSCWSHEPPPMRVA